MLPALLVVLAGCQMAQMGNDSPTTIPTSGKDPEINSTAQSGAASLPTCGQSSPGASAGPERAIPLPKFEVHEKGFTDFGISIVTNFGVVQGKAIEWIRVGTVSPGSSAASLGLETDDEILAIDGRLLSKMTRGEMLHVFFERESGDELKLLVMGTKMALPRFVVLKAQPPAVGKGNEVGSK
jgi:PDZ domain